MRVFSGGGKGGQRSEVSGQPSSTYAETHAFASLWRVKPGPQVGPTPDWMMAVHSGSPEANWLRNIQHSTLSIEGPEPPWKLSIVPTPRAGWGVGPDYDPIPADRRSRMGWASRIVVSKVWTECLILITSGVSQMKSTGRRRRTMGMVRTRGLARIPINCMVAIRRFRAALSAELRVLNPGA